MTVKANVSDSTMTLTIEGQFDFSKVQVFRQCYEDTDSKHYVVDMKNVDYMDSAGLGMLLNMAKHLKLEDRQIKISNCRPQILKLLTISRFDKKFTIGG